MTEETNSADVVDARVATLAARLTPAVLLDDDEQICLHGAQCAICSWERKLLAEHRQTKILAALHPLLTPGFDVGLIEELAEAQQDPATKNTLQRLASFVDVLQGNRQPPPDAEAWTPTPDNINELPLPLRWYLHNLAHRTDPAGDLQTIAVLEQSVAALTARIRELEGQ